MEEQEIPETEAEEQQTPADSPKPQRRNITSYGMAGLLLGLIALAASALSPWIVSALTPEPIEAKEKTLEERASDAAIQIKERITANIQGEDYVPPQPKPEEKEVNWGSVVSGSVIGTGVLAACIGIIGFIREDNPRVTGTTVALGLGAVAFQYLLIFLLMIVGILMLAVILHFVGSGALDIP